MVAWQAVLFLADFLLVSMVKKWRSIEAVLSAADDACHLQAVNVGSFVGSDLAFDHFEDAGPST